eukprot:2979218-Rhodomonas_salina.5
MSGAVLCDVRYCAMRCPILCYAMSDTVLRDVRYCAMRRPAQTQRMVLLLRYHGAVSGAEAAHGLLLQPGSANISYYDPNTYDEEEFLSTIDYQVSYALVP